MLDEIKRLMAQPYGKGALGDQHVAWLIQAAEGWQEWNQKTEWVQDAEWSGKYLEMHRADAMCARLSEARAVGVPDDHRKEPPYSVSVWVLSRLVGDDVEADVLRGIVHYVSRQIGEAGVQFNHADGTATRFDLSPAMSEGRLREALVSLGWIPPETVPAAQPEQDVCRIALEEACIVSWVSADLSTIEGAKKAIAELCSFDVQLATDPATNGGKVLVSATRPADSAVLCKGDYALGTACGKCARCLAAMEARQRDPSPVLEDALKRAGLALVWDNDIAGARFVPIIGQGMFPQELLVPLEISGPPSVVQYRKGWNDCLDTIRHRGKK